MTRQDSAQKGVATIEATFIISLVITVGFLLFDLSQAIRIYNKAGQTAAMLADVATTIPTTTDVAILTENIAQLKLLANGLDSNLKKIRVTILEDGSAMQQLGDDIAPCSPSSSPNKNFLELPRPLPADYRMYVVEVCYEDPKTPSLPSTLGNMSSTFSNLLPAYGMSQAIGR